MKKFEILHSLVGKWPSTNKGTCDASVGRSNNVKCYILPHDFSDHVPVLFTANNKPLIAPPLRPQVRDTRNFFAEDFLINLQ